MPMWRTFTDARIDLNGTCDGNAQVGAGLADRTVALLHQPLVLVRLRLQPVAPLRVLPRFAKEH